jgi:methylenetetrahydrofolate reductase (NADPH)
MAVVKAEDNDAVKQIGIDWCITHKSKELIAAGMVLHYYLWEKQKHKSYCKKTSF